MKKIPKTKKTVLGRPKKIAGKKLLKKMFIIDEETSEVLRNVCHKYRVSFSELIRIMIYFMIEKKGILHDLLHGREEEGKE